MANTRIFGASNALAFTGQPFTAVVIGNSLAALDKPFPSGGYQQLLPTSLFGQMNYQLGQAFLLLSVAGVGGQRISQINARFDTDVTPYRPGYVFAHLLENDAAAASNSLDAAGVKTAVDNARAEVRTFLAKNFAINATPVIYGLTPSAAQITGVGKADVWVQLNFMLAEECSKTKGRAIFLPLHEAYIDIAATYPAGLSGYDDGDFHFNSKGACIAAKKMAPILAKHIPRTPYIFPSHFHGTSASDMGLVANPFMRGSQAAPAALSGNVPAAGVTATKGGTGTAVASLIARTDAPGQWAQIVYTGPASPVWDTDKCGFNTSGISYATAGLEVGDWFQAFWEVDLDENPTNFGGFELEVRFSGSPTLYTRVYGNKQNNNLGQLVWLGSLSPGRGVLATPPCKVSVGTTGIQTFVTAHPGGANAAFTARFGRHYVRNFTKAGITGFNEATFL